MPRRHRATNGAQACHRSQPSAESATPARQSEVGCREALRLPRKTEVDIRKCTPATQSEGGCRQVPRLPRKVPRRHRAQATPKARHRSQPSAVSAAPATHSEGGCREAPHLPAMQNEGRCRQVPRLPRKVKVDIGKCTPAMQSEGGCRQAQRLPRKVPRCHRATNGPQARHRSQPSAVSATQYEAG